MLNVLSQIMLASACVGSPQATPATPRPTSAEGNRTAEFVLRETRIIEAASLPLDGMLATGDPDQLAQQRTGYTVSTETSRGTISTRAGMEETEIQRPNGLKALRFQLNPKERIKLLMKSKDDNLVMRFVKPVKQNSMSASILAANNPPTPFRRKRIEIANPTEEPQDVILLLMGNCGNAYRMEIERK